MTHHSLADAAGFQHALQSSTFLQLGSGGIKKAGEVFDLLPQRPVGRQRQRAHGGLQLFLRGGRAAAIAAGHRSDLDVELFGLFVVKVRVAGVEVVVLLLGAACDLVKERNWSGFLNQPRLKAIRLLLVLQHGSQK